MADGRRLEQVGRDLVEQRLERVVVVPVDQHDVDGRCLSFRAAPIPAKPPPRTSTRGRAAVRSIAHLRQGTCRPSPPAHPKWMKRGTRRAWRNRLGGGPTGARTTAPVGLDVLESARFDQRKRRRRGRPYATKASGNRGTHHSNMNTQALGESATARYANGSTHSTIRGMNRSQLTTNRRPGCFSTAFYQRTRLCDAFLNAAANTGNLPASAARTSTSSGSRPPPPRGSSLITRHVEVGGGRPSLAGWLVVAWVSDGEAARLHIRTNRRTIMMPTVLRIVIDTVTSGSAAKG